MTLTRGRGPFGRESAGTFNFERRGPAHVLYWERCPWRVRVELGGETIADSRRARLLHETGLPPVYYLPLDDVRSERLERSDTTTHCPFKGDARYWSVRVGDRVATDAVWSYPEPIDGAPPLAGHAAFVWERMDCWYEEDRRAFVHARDPYHRVDVMPASLAVEVRAGDTVLGRTTRPLVLYETGLLPRYYLPREDVRLDRLEPSDTRTRCPYKGLASEWWAVAGGAGDVAWAYPEPLAEAREIAGRIAFDDAKVELRVQDLGVLGDGTRPV